MTRERGLARLGERFDVLVIGGGATGLGAAVDAAARGYATALVEASDFAKATSSRSTKLAHGGVRYLQGGNVALVREALAERANLRRNAPHLVDELGFVCPLYRWYEAPYYLAGFKAYDALAGKANFRPSRYLGRRETLRRLPDLRENGLRGSILYYDGRFDDARVALALARTAVDCGAAVVNYARAVRFLYDGGRACGAVVRDEETGEERDVRAKVVVNATGIFVDELRRSDDTSAKPLLQHSRGSHVVFPGDLWLGTDALLVPKTDDGRVLFVIPWHGHVVTGTTDVAVTGAELDPEPTRADVDFIIAQFAKYAQRPPRRSDATATFAGLRPLVMGAGASTAKLSREHLVETSLSGIVSVTGGKWTTYRKMAQDTIDAAVDVAQLARVPSPTATLPLHGSPGADVHSSDLAYASYGTDRCKLLALERENPQLAQRLHPQLPYTAAEVVFAARSEMARTVDDVLSRRTRAAFLDARAAREAAPYVAELLARELGRNATWADDGALAFDRLIAHDSVALID